jgi:hypothetical protein
LPSSANSAKAIKASRVTSRSRFIIQEFYRPQK